MIDFSYSQEYFPFDIYYFLPKYKYSQDYDRKDTINPKPVNGKSLILKRVRLLSNEVK